MSPEYVRPYVKAQKNDDRDAEAIAEAATRPTMVGGGLDQPYREMNSSGPHVDRFLPEQ
jgi:transposase